MPTTVTATITNRHAGRIRPEHLAEYVRSVLIGDPDEVPNIPVDVLDQLENMPPHSIPSPWQVLIHPNTPPPDMSCCVWVQEHEFGDTWTPTCGGGSFRLEEGGPDDNNMRHCCRCGRRLVEMPCGEDEG